MATMLGLIQQATAEMGLTVPTSVAGSTDADTIQQLGLLNAVGYELLSQYPWQALNKEYRFTTQYLTTTGNLSANSAVVTGMGATTGLDSTYMASGTGINQDTYVQTNDSASQVTLSQAATTTGTAVALTFGKAKYTLPSDFDHIQDRTEFDKTKRWSMMGPSTPQQWQWLKSSYISTGPRMRFRIMGGYFQIWPAPSTAEYIGFEYVSNAWVNDNTGVAKSSFTVDTDTCIFPDRLMVLGLKKKYFEIKGFDPSAFTRDYEAQLIRAKAMNSGAQTLSFAPKLGEILIGIENLPDQGYGQTN
jgi:hypothetical protein